MMFDAGDNSDLDVTEHITIESYEAILNKNSANQKSFLLSF